jgi:hypothetical protein
VCTAPKAVHSLIAFSKQIAVTSQQQRMRNDFTEK